MRTSYSAIQTYLQCPQKYKFQEIEKIPAAKSREAIFGTLVHSALKFMFSRDPLFPTLDEVVHHFRQGFLKAREAFEKESAIDSLKRSWTAEDQKLYLERGITMLKKFYEKNAPWNYSVVDLESRFEVALTDEKTGKTHVLAGIIDRIDKTPEGGYEIIDYKTSKRMPSQENVNNDLQLSLYALGLQKRWPHIKTEDIRLSLYFLPHQEKLSTVPTGDGMEGTKTHVLGTISKIESRIAENKAFEPMPGPLCDWCAYKPICPAWRHLYKKQEVRSKNQGEIESIVKEYFTLKSTLQQSEKRLEELQKEIRVYMDTQGLTRVFDDRGMISKKIVQRYEYDFEKIKALLSPLGKWEDVLKADSTKLQKVMREVSEEVRRAIEDARRVEKEYTMLHASFNKSVPEEDTTSE